MKTLSIVTALVLLGLGVAAGWFLAPRGQALPSAGEKKIAFYQSPMHPWIKSDKPGNCTICGMKLTPVYEGEAGFDVGPGVVPLSSNVVNVIHVQTEPVRRLPLTRTLAVAGRIEADKTRYRVISAYVGGRIEELFVNYVGAEVHAGEPLATIYSPELLTAEREYISVLGQTNLTRSPSVAAEHQRVLQAARQRLKRLGLEETQIDKLIDKPATNYTTQITAPISGTVLSRDSYEGQYVAEGDKLFELADLSTMWFRFDVYEQDLPWIRLGQTVRVTSPALAGEYFEGPITFIEPTIDPITRSAKVRVELENPLQDENGTTRRALYNNLYATGAILIESDPVLAVPRTAVLNPGDQPRVYVDNGGGAYEMVPVTLGRHGDDYWEIIEGLSGEEQVVTTGNFLIDSEAQIQSGGGHQHGAPADAIETATEPESPAHDHSAHGHATLAPEQKESAEALFAHAAVVNQALAGDDLDAFNEQVQLLPEAAAELSSRFEDTPWTAMAEDVQQKARLEPAATLAAAREQYLPFSNHLARFILTLRKAGALQGPVIFECPMYPRMGQKALWVQLEQPLRNPFFGSEMLECGTAVK